MQDHVQSKPISREDIIKRLKAAYKIKDDNPEDLERKRAEFLSGFNTLGDWHAEQGRVLVDGEQDEGKNPATNEENKLITNRHLLTAVALYDMAIASEFYMPRKEENSFQEITASKQPISQQLVTANQQRLIQKIKSIENQIVLSVGVPATEQTAEAYWQKNQKAKNMLRIIRLQTREALSKISKRNSDDETIEIIEAELPNVQRIYHNIAEGQQQLIRELLDDCLQQLPPPERCIYSIIVLGSLAREEATPYSDFEWAILFQDQGEERNALHKTYFRRLAELLWIKVLNLGETTSRMMDIEGINGKDEETYGPIPKGFSFDGQMPEGCHTPLGNRHHKVIQHKYELIGMPHELAQFQQNTWEHKRGLSTVLSTVAVIQSNDAALEHSLIEQYETKMKEIWNMPEEQINQRTGEVTHQTLIQRRSLRFLAESSESFKFQGGRFDKEAHYFDAKYHLYRLPNMLIDHLVSYFGITQQKNLWDRIEAIWGEQGKATNSDAVQHLKRTISTILTIRSQAYLRKDHRDDHVLMFDSSHPEKNQYLLKKYLGINQEILFQIFYVLIPLQLILENFVKTKGTITTLNEDSYHDPSLFAQATIYNLLLDYSKAIAFYEKAREDYKIRFGDSSIILAIILNNLSIIYQIQGHYTKAVTGYKEARRIIIVRFGNQHILVADAFNNLGLIYQEQGYYKKAIAAHEKAKNIRIIIHGKQHISLADTLSNLGLVYQAQGRYEKAIAAHEKAMNIRTVTYGEQHISVAQSLHNLGDTYQAKSLYAKAISMYQKAMHIKIYIYGELHTSVANTLNSLGAVYDIQENYDEAIAVYEKAKHIYIAVHGEQHISIANILNNLGAVYFALGYYTKANAEFEAAKCIKIIAYGKQHISVAETLNNLGLIYQAQGHYTKSIEMLEEAKRIKIATHGEHHILVASTLNSLGLVYLNQGCYPEAIAVFEQAKRIYIATHGEQHILVASTLNNLGLVFVEQRRFEEGRRQCFQKAMSIFQQLNHPNQKRAKVNFELSYFREGNIFLLQEPMDIEQAKLFYQKFNILEQPVEPINPESHQLLASLFYNRNNLLPTIEHYQILLRLAPDDVSAYHNLACMLHIRAQIEKDKGDEAQYKAYLEETKSHFETAIGLEANTGVCTEYALFMWKNRDYFQIETIIAILQKAITLGQLERELSYGMMERPAVIEQLQELIDEESSVSFKAIHLAYYLQILIRCETNQFELANGDMSLLAANVIEFNAEIEGIKQQLSDQVNKLLQHASQEQSEDILNKQQTEIKCFEKQQRLVNNLVVLSQVIIKLKLDEMASGASQINNKPSQKQDIKDNEMPQKSTAHYMLTEIKKLIGQNASFFEMFLKALNDKCYAKALRILCNNNDAEYKKLIYQIANQILVYKDKLGFDINEKAGEKQWSALDYALSKNNRELCELLSQYGATKNPDKKKASSPAQLIPQFSSVIQWAPAKNPNVLQQTQTSEQITGADRINSSAEDTEAEHDNTRKLSNKKIFQ